MKLIIRADDFGYSKSVNDGILDALDSHLIQSVSVMPTMAYVNYRLDDLKQRNVELGLHANICVGKPICDVPSLVDENGNFFSSKVYRESNSSFIQLEDVEKEIHAQVIQFQKIVGRMPDYIDVHALVDPIFLLGVKCVAKQFNCIFVDMKKNDFIDIQGKHVYFDISKGNEESYEQLKSLLNKEYSILVLHPGYVDEDLIKLSSLTYKREHEIQFLLDSKTKSFIKENRIELIGFKEIIWQNVK